MGEVFTSREVAESAGIPYPTLMRWHKARILLRRGPQRRAPGGGGLLWTLRDLLEARIAGSLRDYISRAEGPLYEVMTAVQSLEELPRDPALHLDAQGRPSVVEYDPQTDDLRLFASTESRRAWARRRTPTQRWLDMEEIHRMDGAGEERRPGPRSGMQPMLDLFGP